MPNYTLVANTQFQPFTYQELLAPVKAMSDYHEKLAQEYDNISSQADILEAMGTDDRDKDTAPYSRYKSYSDALRKEADELYQHGLNSESRRRLSELRRRYNTDIVPIQNAWNKRQKEAEQQQQALLQHPELRFTRNAANTSLEHYINNPEGGYGVINLNSITAQMAGMAKNLAKLAREKDSRLEEIDPYTYKYISPHGIDPNLISEWQADPTKSTVLTDMMRQVLKANGADESLLDTPNGRSIMEEAVAAAQRAAWEAVGDDKEEKVENYGKRLWAGVAADVAKARKIKDMENPDLPDMPVIGEERTGIRTKNGYVYNAKDILNPLRGGTNALKAAYFGKNGEATPLAAYDDYQEELNKRLKALSQQKVKPGQYNIARKAAEDEAKKVAMKKHGVSAILSKEQYDLLSGMGYDRNSTFNRYSDLEDRMNTLATEGTRYSVRMADLGIPDSSIRNNILRMNDTQLRSGMLWKLDDRGNLGKQVKDLEDLDLRTKDDTKGNQITDIQYDPYHKSKILVTLSDGQRYVASPHIVDATLAKQIEVQEQMGFSPRNITRGILMFLRDYNKGQSKTSSK